jgi:HK97 family phage major capsid protein
MSKELFEKRNKLTYDLRLALDKWEADNKRPTHEFDVRANALLKESVERLEKDLDQVESELSRSQIAEKHAKREAELAKPEYETRAALKANDAEKDYEKRFGEALFSGNRVALERVMSERTSLGTLSSINSNSSPAIPVQWQNRIVERINQFNIMRSICPVKNVVGDQKIVVGGALPTSYKVTENAAITEDSTFAVSNVDVLDLTYACFIPITKQYQTDAIGGLEYVAKKAGESLANILETEYTVGAGTSGNMPGIMSAGFSSYDSSTPSTFTLALWAAKANNGASDDLIELAHTVKAQYRPGCVYMMNDTVAKTIRKLKDTTNNYIWKNPDRYADIRDGMPSTIYGFPVMINTAHTATAGDGNKFITFFNPEFYEIYDRNGGVDVMIDPYGLSTSLITRLVVSHRTYGVCTNTEAGAFLTF